MVRRSLNSYRVVTFLRQPQTRCPTLANPMGQFKRGAARVDLLQALKRYLGHDHTFDHPL